MGALITFVGILIGLVSLVGLALGLFMAVDHRTREPGLLFTLWWTPALAAAAGIIMRDPVTFFVGVFCFVVAGLALYFERAYARKAAKAKRFSADSERTTSQAIETRNRTGDKTAS